MQPLKILSPKCNISYNIAFSILEKLFPHLLNNNIDRDLNVNIFTGHQMVLNTKKGYHSSQ